MEYLALGWTVYFHSGFTTEWELLLEIGQTIYHAKISHVMQWKLSLHIFFLLISLFFKFSAVLLRVIPIIDCRATFLNNHRLLDQ